LRRHSFDTFEPLATLWADPRVIQHIRPKPFTRQESWQRLLRYAGMWSILGYGYWAVHHRQSGQYLGDVGFADHCRNLVPPIHGVPEAGWVISAADHGKGYGYEAALAAHQWLDRHRKPVNTVCIIDDKNVASIRIAHKLGYQRVGPAALDDGEVILFKRHCHHQ
jgi:RimJ/RimL family protein N-acetyltransferase